MKNVKKVLQWVTSVEYAVMVIAFVIMVVSYFISVLNRNVIKASMPWTEELATYSMVYLALLGMEVGLRDGTQVAVTAVTSKLHGMTEKVVSVVEQIVLELFSLAMFRAGILIVAKQLQTGQMTPVLKGSHGNDVFFSGSGFWNRSAGAGSCPDRKNCGIVQEGGG